MIGNEPGEQKSITILNRELRWKPGEISLEADPTHVKRIVEEMRLMEGSKGLEAPRVKEKTGECDEEDEEEMGREEASRFRAVAARANYLGIDRPDICEGSVSQHSLAQEGLLG